MKMRCWQFTLAWHYFTIQASDCSSAIGRYFDYLAAAHPILECVGMSWYDHPQVDHRRMHLEQSSLLAAVLSS
jgi:hypothetical protein